MAVYLGLYFVGYDPNDTIPKMGVSAERYFTYLIKLASAQDSLYCRCFVNNYCAHCLVALWLFRFKTLWRLYISNGGRGDLYDLAG